MNVFGQSHATGSADTLSATQSASRLFSSHTGLNRCSSAPFKRHQVPGECCYCRSFPTNGSYSLAALAQYRLRLSGLSLFLANNRVQY